MLAMTIRVIMSWFVDGDNMLFNFLYNITEPIVMPMRKLLRKFNSASGFPLDISFFITYILLVMLRTTLEIWF